MALRASIGLSSLACLCSEVVDVFAPVVGEDGAERFDEPIVDGHG